MEKVKDLEIKLTLKHYKGVKDGDYIFDGSYLYLVKGQNKIGKTSIIEAFISLMKAKIDTPDPIERGKDEAIIRGILPGPKGMYTVEVTITKTGAKFIMFTPENIKVSTVTEIRKVFEYNILSVEDFIRKSYTPEGRRQQIKMILELLPEKAKENYIANLKALDPKKGKLYERRRDIDSQLKSISFLIEEFHISKEDAELIEKKAKVEKAFEEVKISKASIDDYDEIKKKANDIIKRIENVRQDTNSFITNTKNDINENLDEIASLKARIKTIETKIDTQQKAIKERKEVGLAQIEKLEKEKKQFDIAEPDPDMVETILSQYVELETELETIKELEIKNENLIKYLDKKKDLDKKYEAAQKAIEDKRKENKAILAKSDLKNYNIEIKDDTLYVDGLVFNEHQVADSILTLTATKILIKALKSSQIMVVGKLAELDTNSRRILYEIGEQNNIAIVGDDVDDNYDSIYVSEFIPGNIPNIKSFSEKVKPTEEVVQDQQEDIPNESPIDEELEKEESKTSNFPPEKLPEIDPKETRDDIENSMSDTIPFTDDDLI